MRNILLVILAIISASLPAQELTLKSCIDTCLQKNFSLRISRNEQQIAKNNVTLANAGYLPTLDLKAGYNADLTSSSGKLRSTGNTESSYNSLDHSLNAGINLEWTIFDGFNISTTYKQLKEFEQIGEANTRLILEEFVADLIAEYYNFVQQRCRLENYYHAVQLSKERLRVVEERYNIGNFSRLDYQQAKVDFYADSAKYIKQQEVVLSSRIALNEMMANEAVYTPIETKEKDIEADATLLFADLWNNMLEKNTNLKLAESDRRLSEMDYKKVLSRNYPYVKFNAGYNYTFSKYDTNSYTRRSNWGGSAGITVGFNLWDGNRKREKKNARIKIDNAKLERDRLELALKAELGNLWQAYQNNLQLIKLEKENVITARENHEIAIERHMLGDISGIEMREAQQSLIEAEERLLSAKFQTKLCEISLRLISGDIDIYMK